jgi:nitrate reductase NapA
MRETIATHGRNSVAMYGSAQWSVTDAYVAAKLFKGAIGTNNIETSARLYAGSGMEGLRSSFGLDGSPGCYDDLDQADVFVIWNGNLAETDPVLFSRMLERRRKSPAVRIIELSSSSSRTSYAADLALLHAPQSELAIANAICREIVARDRADRDFVDRHVAFKSGRTNIGYAVEGDVIRGEEGADATWDDYVDFLSPYTPEHAQQLSGVSLENIRYLASLYGNPALNVMSVWGIGVNQHCRGTWLNNLLNNIHLLVGKIAAPGNGPLSLTDQPSGGAAIHNAGACTEGLPRGTVENAEDRRFAAGIWGVPADRIDAQPTHSAMGIFRALERGEIRFLWIQATNPMISLPNLSRYRRAAAGNDSFIVVSEVYPTRTVDIADVVLPAALWVEREGVLVNSERRVQHFERMLAPPRDAMSDAWQMIEVARRLGFADLFPWERNTHATQIWEEYARFHTDIKDSLPPLAELKTRPGAMWPFVNGQETKWRYNSTYDPAADKSRGRFDFYGHPDHRAWIWLRPHEPPAEATDDRYPFWLSVGRVIEHWGSGAMTRRIPVLHRAQPRAYVEMNRSDATRLGIRDGETVRVVSRRGSLNLEARVDFRTQPLRGHLFVPTFDEGAPVNVLTLDALCPISGQPDFGKCAVRVERIAEAAG